MDEKGQLLLVPIPTQIQLHCRYCRYCIVHLSADCMGGAYSHGAVIPEIGGLNLSAVFCNGFVTGCCKIGE